MAFNKNVFINCPFDPEYKPLLKSLLFCLVYLGYEPQIIRTSSSSHSRIDKIKKLIRNSKFGIHDLSRSKPMKSKDLPRFNMPYELGLDIGCQYYGKGKVKSKKILILETQKYYYQKVISDISGQDIKSHRDKPPELITVVRNWFSNNSSSKKFPPGSEVWESFNQFNNDLQSKLLNQGYKKKDINLLETHDYIKFSKDWIKQFMKRKKT